MHPPPELAPEPTTLYLTATRRLARELRRRHDHAQRAAGARAWPALAAVPVSSWLYHVWEASWPTATALGSGAELCLWEQVIAAAPAPGTLLGVAETAREARRARTLLVDWRLPGPGPQRSEEVRRFTAWDGAFRARLADEGWIDEAGVRAAAVALIDSGHRVLPAGCRAVQLLGFDRVTPLVRRLGEALARGGVPVRGDAVPRPPPPSVPAVRPRDARAELRAAAAWCRELLVREPEARIGVVVTDLAERFDAVRTAFEEELTPGAATEQDPSRHPRPFEVSFAPPLAAYPVVHVALGLVTAATRACIEAPFLRMLLRSPFLHEADNERLPRARFARWLDDERRRVRHTLASIAAELGSKPHGGDRPWRVRLPALAHRVAGWREWHAALPARALPSEWSGHFVTLLERSGWPGERALDSAEFQTVECFRELLAELSALDRVTGELDAGAALARLGGLARDREFQPEGAGTSVQVVGVRQAVGLRFDHLWLAGFQREAWPRAGSPHPFLNSAWQRDHELPHTSVARELTRARQLTERLLGAAPEVVVSVPERGDDRELVPSAVLPPLDVRPVSEVTARVRVRLAAGFSRDALERVTRDRAPAVLGDGNQRGGVRVFADQAACPFRAFARHRLGAQAPRTPDESVSALDRGSLLHDVLEEFWRDWKDHRTLVSRSADDRDRAIDALLARFARERLDARSDLPQLYRRLELERTRRVLRQWLELEAGRSPGFTVVAVEEACRITRGGLTVEVKIDRLDRLDDGTGRLAVIDYKTGRNTPEPGGWDGVRPEDPQLPLYVLERRDEVGAMAFAHLGGGVPRFVGRSRDADRLPGVKAYKPRAGQPADWDAQLEEWEQRLTQLAEEFAGGHAAVDPKHVEQSCRYCDLHALCRIGERGSDAEAIEEDELDVLEELPDV